MDDTRRSTLTRILCDHFKAREEGWMWIAFEYDDRDDGVVNQFEGEFVEIGHAGAHNLIHIIELADPDDVLVFLCRAEGKPREFDREFWRLVRDTFDGSSITIVDMVVFNGDGTYSMRDEDAGRYELCAS
jgi:hypothetical protein